MRRINADIKRSEQYISAGGKKKKVGVPVEQFVRRPPTSSRPGEGGAAKMDAGIASDSIVLGYDPVPSECDKC